MAKTNVDRTRNLLASVTEEMLGSELAVRSEDNGLHVERILLELVRPHPVQPRRVLPERIHQAFHAERLTPSQALRELIQLVQVAARQRSRPFANVLDLVADSSADDQPEPVEVVLSPEEVLLRDLVNLAITIRDDGQVNPLTVVDASHGVTRLYRIETGERRYWATWLLRDFIRDSNSSGTIPCIIVPSEMASVFRQAKENTSRAGLSAIAMARQAALLLMAAHGYEIPDQPVENDFYRQALDLDLRSKREYTDLILSAMGGLGRMHFSRYKALLKLSDDALELADRYQLDERRLRFVASMPMETHTELVRQIVTMNLTSRQVEEICRSDDAQVADDLPADIPAKALKMARMLHVANEMSARDVAQALRMQEPDIHLARARIHAMRELLNDAEQFLGEP